MSRNDYIVLRRQAAPDAGDPFTPGGGLESLEPPRPQVSVESLDTGDLATLRRSSDVEAIAPPFPVHLIEPTAKEALADAPAAGTTWGVSAVRATESPYTGAGVTVAVLDTGIDASHPAFQGVDIVQRDFTGEGDGDGNGHGTHVAGTIFGQEVNGFRFGVAPGIQRALIGKVLNSSGSGSTEGIVRAMQWAFDEGANIISMSLGMSFPRFVQRLIEEIGWPSDLATDVGLQGYRANLRIFDRLTALLQGSDNTPFFRDESRGTLVIAAAGNESRRQIDPMYEVAVAPPAAANGAISVGALGEAGDAGNTLVVANFSNTGCNVSGPGVGVISSVPGGGFSSFNGTSMATPHVAGVAALWAEKMLVEKQWINTRQLASLVLGRAANDRFAADIDPFDVGAGLAQAPLS